MSKAATKATIDANIKTNGNQEITGQILNSVLNTMVDDYATQEDLIDLERICQRDELDIISTTGYIATTGARVASSSRTIFVVSTEISPSWKRIRVKVANSIPNHTLAIAFYTTDYLVQASADNFISGVLTDSSRSKWYDAEIPDNCKCIRVCNMNSLNPNDSVEIEILSDMKSIKGEIDGLRNSVESVVDSVDTIRIKNFSMSEAYIHSRVFINNGVWYTGSASYPYSGCLYKVSKGDVYEITANANKACQYAWIVSPFIKVGFAPNYIDGTTITTIAAGIRETITAPNNGYLYITGEVGNNNNLFPAIFNKVITSTYIEDIEHNVEPMPMVEAIILQASRADRNNESDIQQKRINLVHFSDIHNYDDNLIRIKQFCDKYASYIDDVIVTGDMCGGYFDDYSALYAQDGYDKILQVIGNHDAYATSAKSESDLATDTAKFAKFMSNISKWGVTHDGNNSHCYYYKDYDLDATTSPRKLRLIVLDAMSYTQDQSNWLISVLNDAREKAYAVMIAEHFPITQSIDDIVGFNTSFHSLHDELNAINYLAKLTGSADECACDSVDNFIAGGGEFVCWIAGHTHYDQTMLTTLYGNQLCIVVGGAGSEALPNRDVFCIGNDFNGNMFNFMSIDTRRKIISIYRIGSHVDQWLRPRNAVSIDYANRKMLSTW